MQQRGLTDAELERAGKVRLRAAREMNAGVGCVAVMGLSVGLVMMGLVILIVWLGGGWKWTFWGVVLAGVSLIPAAIGALALILGAYAVVSYVRRRIRLARGWRPLLKTDGPTFAFTFEATEAWIIDANEGEPVGVWRVEEDAFLLAPTSQVEFTMPTTAAPPDQEPAPLWGLARAGKGVILKDQELGWLDLTGPTAPTPVLAPPESAYDDPDDEVGLLLTTWNLEARALVKPLALLPRWLRWAIEGASPEDDAGSPVDASPDSPEKPGDVDPTPPGR
jgi:hypothetical protein